MSVMYSGSLESDKLLQYLRFFAPLPNLEPIFPPSRGSITPLIKNATTYVHS